MPNCQICELPLEHEDMGVCTCMRCGRFEFDTRGAVPLLRDVLTDPGPQQRRRANLSHLVRRRTRKGQSHVLIPVAELDRWGLDNPLPTPAEALDELVLWVGDNQPTINDGVLAQKLELSAWLGLSIGSPGRLYDSLEWLLGQPDVARLVQRSQREAGELRLDLTWQGWTRYTELKRREATSFTAFMAMKFGDADLDDVVDNHFKPAVAEAGFTLRRVTDGQGAGLIDDQMRVGLRTSRFVIADLTHASRGAYWESGFAEGLGKPVIYTCRRDQWEMEGSHFDTNHLVTVVWDPAEIETARAVLKARVRATLPDVARMED